MMNRTVQYASIAAIAFSSSAPAATLYKEDDLTLRLRGDFQVQLYQEPGVDEDLDVNFDDLELKFGATYSLEQNMKAFGELDIDWKKQGDGSDDDVVNKAYVGITVGPTTVSIGRQLWGSDNLFTEQAIEFDASKAFDSGLAFPETSGQDTIKVTYDAKRFQASITYDLADSDTDESATDLWLGTKGHGIDLGFAFQRYESGDSSIETVGVMAKIKAGPASIGLDFSSNEDLKAFNISSSFKLNQKTKVAIGINKLSPDQGDEALFWYGNITHKLHKNVNVFTELGNSDLEDSDIGFLAGMRLKF